MIFPKESDCQIPLDNLGKRPGKRYRSHPNQPFE